MADNERLTKRERRERSRADRKAKEIEQAKQARRKRAVSTVIAVLVTAGVVTVLVLAFVGGPAAIDDTIVLAVDEVEDARASAGCEFYPVPDLGAGHFTPETAPPPDVLYPQLRPPAGGPHFERLGVVTTFSRPQDERQLVHNLEHGAVIVWYDADRLTRGAIDEIESWARTLNASGFEYQSFGAGVITAPYEGPFTSGKPIAWRAWGVAMDCDSFDETAAHSFALENFGSHGRAPEGGEARFPDGVMRYAPGEQPAPEPEPDDGGTEDGTDEGTESDG